MKINKKKIWTELSSPFLTLLIGAIISGLLIPYITTTWQNHAKALEIKTEIINLISKALSKAIVTAQFAVANSSAVNEIEFHNSAIGWSEISASIESQLLVYFPDKEISEEWKNFSRIVLDYYFLAAEGAPEFKRIERISNLKDYFNNSSEIEWNLLLTKQKSDILRYDISWKSLGNIIVVDSTRIIDKILSTPIDVL